MDEDVTHPSFPLSLYSSSLTLFLCPHPQILLETCFFSMPLFVLCNQFFVILCFSFYYLFFLLGESILGNVRSLEVCFIVARFVYLNIVVVSILPLSFLLFSLAFLSSNFLSLFLSWLCFLFCCLCKLKYFKSRHIAINTTQSNMVNVIIDLP